MKQQIAGAEKVLIYDNRVIISYDIGAVCKFDCVYCYNVEDIKVSQVQDLEGIIARLASISDTFEIVTAGCEQELFLNPKKAIDFLRKVEKLDKILSFSTKVPLTKEVVYEIRRINDRLKLSGNYIVGEVSFVAGVDLPTVEKRVPSVSSRIETLRRLSSEGIYAVPFVRPVLPDEFVHTEDVYELVDRTENFCRVYATGDFYFNQKIRRRMCLRRLGPDFWDNVIMDVEASYLNIEDITWYKYVNETKKENIRKYVESKGKFCYDSSTDAIMHFKKR